jgi:Coenzyme PQQ synthesis protein D (PqqD)
MMTHDRSFRGVTVVTGVTHGASEAVRRPDWVAHVLDEAADPPRAVLLHLPSGRRIGLSDTATRVWQEIVASGEDGVAAAAVATRIAPEYGVETETIVPDIVDLYEQLLDGEWVERVGGAPS